MLDLDALYQRLGSRRTASPETSWTAKLMHGGVTAIAKKIAEESMELALAARELEMTELEQPGQAHARARVEAEAADLLYHYLVLLTHLNISPQQVMAVLEGRTGQSGVEEKQQRGS